MNDNFSPAAAEFLRANPRALCITAHDGDSAALQKMLAADGGLSPQIISAQRLHTAAAAGIRPENLISAARLATVSAAAIRRQWILAIYDLLRDSSPDSKSKTSQYAELLLRAAALADFFAEFMESRPSLEISAAELPQLCEKMARDSNPLAAEADAVSLLWQTLHSRLHIARKTLAEFARIAPPLIYAGAESPRPWLRDFLRQCANAEIFAPDETAAPTAEDIYRWHPNVRHIRTCREGAADSLHRAAHLALATVRDFAANGDSVGIVVYDRLLARRLRAVAEERGVRITDDGGWRMETLSFGGALRQWTETVFAFSPANFGAILSPPFWRKESRRAAAAEEWRQCLAGHDALPDSLHDFSRPPFAQTAFAPFAATLETARRKRPTAAPPHLWTRWLLRHAMAATAAWKNDPVAVRLRARLAAKESEERLNASEFRAWLHLFMRTETGGDEDISARAHFVSPKTGRRFDSLLLLGADAARLPVSPPSFWGDNGRRAMQLPGGEEEIAQQLSQFDSLVAAHSRIAAVRRIGEDGRDSAPSPFWTLLIEEIKKHGCGVKEIVAPPEEFFIHTTSAADLHPPPHAKGKIYAPPAKVRVTAAADLMKCPYHFFARHLLRLREEDEDDILLPAGRGGLLHRGLREFAENAGDERDGETLLALWRRTISALPAARPGARLAIQHWLLCGESFIRGETARRAEGWIPVALEKEVNAAIPAKCGGFVLRGRIDRADRNNETGEWTITDYKSGGAPGKKEMQTGEEPQLPLYAILFGKPRAKWRISTPTKDDKSVETEGDARRIAARLRRAAARIANGAPLPARISDACKQCASRRLCRRDHWQIAE